MLVKQISIVAVLAGLILASGGCRPSIIGSDAGVYYSGRLHAVSSRDLTSVYDATVKALQKLEVDITEQAKDAFSAKVVAKGADGKVIRVIIKPRTDNLTDLSVKVGPVGNRERSRVIYERIQQNLTIRGK